MPNVSGKRVLIFGDSMSAGAGSPGDELGRNLASTGATVTTNALVGRSANNFFGREDVAGQFADIAAFAPQVVIVQLGTNDIGLSMAVDGARMEQLRAAFAGSGADVWAIGPPTFPSSGPGADQTPGAPSVVAMMTDVFGASRFIDMRPLTADMAIAGQGGRAADGTHFTSAGGQVIGKRLADEFMKAGGPPIGTVLMALLFGTLAWAIAR